MLTSSWCLRYSHLYWLPWHHFTLKFWTLVSSVWMYLYSDPVRKLLAFPSLSVKTSRTLFWMIHVSEVITKFTCSQQSSLQDGNVSVGYASDYCYNRKKMMKLCWWCWALHFFLLKKTMPIICKLMWQSRPSGMEGFFVLCRSPPSPWWVKSESKIPLLLENLPICLNPAVLKHPLPAFLKHFHSPSLLEALMCYS